MKEKEFIEKCKDILIIMKQEGISINEKELRLIKDAERFRVLAENRKKAIMSLIRSYDKLSAKLYRQSILQSAFNRANERANRFEKDLETESLELQRRRDLFGKSIDEIDNLKKEINEFRSHNDDLLLQLAARPLLKKE